MGRKKLEIKKITDKGALFPTFSKRRRALNSMVADLCVEHDCRGALFVRSPAVNPTTYSFGHPSVDAVAHEYMTGFVDLSYNAAAVAEASALWRQCKEEKREACALRKRVEEEEERVRWEEEFGSWDQVDYWQLGTVGELAAYVDKTKRLREYLDRFYGLQPAFTGDEDPGRIVLPEEAPLPATPSTGATRGVDVS